MTALTAPAAPLRARLDSRLSSGSREGDSSMSPKNGMPPSSPQPLRARLRTDSNLGLAESPYLPEQRPRLRTESGYGMPASPYIFSQWGLPPGTAPGLTAGIPVDGYGSYGSYGSYDSPYMVPPSHGMHLGHPPAVAALPPDFSMLAYDHVAMAAAMTAAAALHAPPHGTLPPPGTHTQRIRLNSLLGSPPATSTSAPMSGYPYGGMAPPQQPPTRAAPGMAARQRPQQQAPRQQLQHQHLSYGGSAASAGYAAPSERRGSAANKAAVRAAAAASANVPDSGKTTVMLRNLPEGFSRDALLQLLDSEGFNGRYDFAYLPVDFDTLQGLRHAFVNMVSPAEAAQIRSHLEGFTKWDRLSDSVCSVAWNDRQQGLPSLVDRYRNSPVMHETVPDECKPIILASGRRAPFPPPTQKIKAPKILKGKQ